MKKNKAKKYSVSEFLKEKYPKGIIPILGYDAGSTGGFCYLLFDYENDKVLKISIVENVGASEAFNQYLLATSIIRTVKKETGLIPFIVSEKQWMQAKDFTNITKLLFEDKESNQAFFLERAFYWRVASTSWKPILDVNTKKGEKQKGVKINPKEKTFKLVREAYRKIIEIKEPKCDCVALAHLGRLLISDQVQVNKNNLAAIKKSFVYSQKKLKLPIVKL